ncbi:MAG: J domain-containing protein [Deltaproteobacteria bacterium]
MRWLKRFWPLLLALLYLASPIDAIPDSLVGLGWVDDLVLLLLAYWLVKRVLPSRYGQTRDHTSGRPHQSGPDPAKKAATDPYQILGVPRNASQQEIKSAFRKQAQRYHPDRVSHLGEEFQQLAKEKFQEIQKAYETLSGGAR